MRFFFVGSLTMKDDKPDIDRIVFLIEPAVKDKDYCPIETIKGLTDKGQFQYLTKLMGHQEGTYLYAT